MTRSCRREVFCKKGVLKILSIVTKTPVLNSLFKKVAAQVYKFIKKRLQQRCFPVNIANILLTLILKKICERLFLNKFNTNKTYTTTPHNEISLINANDRFTFLW